ncbi:MAG: hypothetical protein AAGF49_03710 [Pseudomonadota bacterium]
MDMPVPSAIADTGASGVVVGFRGHTATAGVDDPAIVWTSDETTLFRADIDAFVIQDCRLISDLTLALTVGRPTLFVLNGTVDFAHLAILQAAREVILTPLDAVYAAAGSPPIEGLREHLTADPRGWIAAKGRLGLLPATLGPFNALSKAAFRTISRKIAAVKMPTVQHFWRLVGAQESMAQTMMATARMMRTGVGGPFDAVTPTVLFVDPAQVDHLGDITLRQSTIVVAPFALPIGAPIDTLLTTFVDARREPFHLHEVLTFGDVEETTIGCLFGEYVV